MKLKTNTRLVYGAWAVLGLADLAMGCSQGPDGSGKAEALSVQGVALTSAGSTIDTTGASSAMFASTPAASVGSFASTEDLAVGSTAAPNHVLAAGLVAAKATDPGPRPGPAGAGAPQTPEPIAPDNAQNQRAAAAACLSTGSNTNPAPGLSPAALLLCEQAVIRFQEIDSVSGDKDGNVQPVEIGVGLGPTFNGNNCAQCHAQPAVLGSSPGLHSPQNPINNPQVALATLDNALNLVPSFIKNNGPVREARFISDPGVHDLFTIAGRNDAPGCSAAQPDFATQLANGNVIFRIPTPVFGAGLVENTSDSTLQNTPIPPNAPSDASLSIAGGVFNTSGNDGTITRFGWKGQNKSLLIFAGEAYNVEQGVSNENFPNERMVTAGCTFNGTPEDNTNPAGSGTVSDTNSDTSNFAMAMRLSAPPSPASAPFMIGNATITTTQLTDGFNSFVAIGCANCHSPSLQTAASGIDPALSAVTYHPFSDFAIHHMGQRLSDGISQGGAGPDQFRTAPLWGVGQRLFFMHDGRTANIARAIELHQSAGSEANTVIGNFNGLTPRRQQDIVYFLRSL